MATPPSFHESKLRFPPPDTVLDMRRMTHHDLTQVLRNERSAYSHPWTEGIFLNCLSSRYENWVADSQGALLGHAVLSITLNEAHLLNVCVAASYQRRGLGSKLVEFVSRRAKLSGAESLLLEVRLSNAVAIKLYESSGFFEIGRRRDYYPAQRGREDALVMMLPLLDDPQN
jgi:[ribosomal protein S18]-alanine N-acetyltransferase